MIKNHKELVWFVDIYGILEFYKNPIYLQAHF